MTQPMTETKSSSGSGLIVFSALRTSRTITPPYVGAHLHTATGIEAS